MKQTKTKVLLTLLVAVAMMLFAVPAFAASTDGSLWVSSQPTSVTAYSGSNAVFSVTASDGTTPYSYQWFVADSQTATGSAVVNNTDYSGATTEKLTVVAGTNTAKYYYCVVTDYKNVTAKSDAAQLVVKTAPTVTVGQASDMTKKAITLNSGDTTTLKAVVGNPDADANYTYQWQVAKSKDKTGAYVWEDISGATNQTYKTDKADISMDNYAYNCKVTDANSKVVSGTYTATTPVTLTVKATAAIKTNPSDAAVTQKASSTVTKDFVAEYVGGVDVTATTWYYSKDNGTTWTAITNGQTTPFAGSIAVSGKKSTLTVTVPQKTVDSLDMNGYQFKFEVTDGTAKATSTAAKLTVNPALSVSTTPATSPISIARDNNGTTLKATAAGGTGSYTYLWKDPAGNNVSGYDTLTLTKEQVAADVTPGSGYQCTVTDQALDTVRTINFYFVLTDGSITSGTLEGAVNSATLSGTTQYTVTLPDGYAFRDDINLDNVLYTKDGTDQYFTMNLPAGLSAKVVSNNTSKLTFKITGKPTESSTDVISLTVNSKALKATGTTAVPANGIAITSNADAKYKITQAVSPIMVTVDPGSVSYTGKAQDAKVVEAAPYKDKLGAISNIRYKKAGALSYSTTAPTEVGDYYLVCDVAASDQYTAATDVRVGSPDGTTEVTSFHITKATLTKDFLTYTQTKEYTGNKLSADVKFADGITKAGKISKVEYLQNGQVVDPIEIGKYTVKVYTSADATNVDTNVGANANGVEIGTFEITKTAVTKAMFTSTPTTAEFTGNPIAVTVAPTKDYADKVGAVTVKYFTADGKTQLAGAPTAAGKYVIKVDVAASDTYAAATDLEVGTLTINATTAPSITYAAHVQNIGDQKAVSDWGIAGTEGQALRMEAITISVPTTANVQLKAQAHVQNIGWDAKEIKTGSTVTVGTKGQSLRMEALRLQLTGTDAAKYQIRVKAHIQNYGWTDDKVITATDAEKFATDACTIGTTGQGLRMEAIKIVIEPLGTK